MTEKDKFLQFLAQEKEKGCDFYTVSWVDDAKLLPEEEFYKRINALNAGMLDGSIKMEPVQ